MAKKRNTQVAAPGRIAKRLSRSFKFKSGRIGLSKYKNSLVPSAAQAIAYIGPEWKSQQRRFPRKLHQRKLKGQSKLGLASADVSALSTDSAFNVFCDLIPQDISHETITIDDSALCASDNDGDITVVKQVCPEDGVETSRAPSDTFVADVSSDSEDSVITLSDSDADRDTRSIPLPGEVVPDQKPEVVFIGESHSSSTVSRRPETSQPTSSQNDDQNIEDLTLLDETLTQSGVDVSTSTVLIETQGAGSASHVVQQTCSSWSVRCRRARGGKSPRSDGTPNLNSNSLPSSGRVPSLTTVPRPVNHSDASMVFVDLLTEGTAHLCRQILRRWDPVKTSAVGGSPIRICSYNVLCQDTVAKTMYLYAHLTSSLLAREFSLIGADIFCLQEVQAEHFVSFYRPLFSTLGYSGKFKKRTRDMKDGCAIFFRPPLSLASYQPLEYFVGTDTILDRDNIGQIARFRHGETGKELCVANTHLLFNQKRGDVKLAQLALLLANIDKECGAQSASACPYVMCGDFNMSPSSAIANFVTTGRMSLEGLRRGHMSGAKGGGGPYVRPDFMPAATRIGTRCRFESTPEDLAESTRNNQWTHPLDFASVYTHTSLDQWPEVSAYTCTGASNPDFIFYSVNKYETQGSGCPTSNRTEGSLQLVKRLALPSELLLRATLGPWPNEATPSDHIPLIADFVLL